jgi:hypothetical protein
MAPEENAPITAAPRSSSQKPQKSSQTGRAKNDSQEGDHPQDEAVDFLDRHPTAKIVVVIDTHCLEETGGFIFKGNTPETYAACSMAEVSTLWL